MPVQPDRAPLWRRRAQHHGHAPPRPPERRGRRAGRPGQAIPGRDRRAPATPGRRASSGEGRGEGRQPPLPQAVHRRDERLGRTRVSQTSATARRAASSAWAAMRARASVSGMPRCSTSRRTRTDASGVDHDASGTGPPSRLPRQRDVLTTMLSPGTAAISLRALPHERMDDPVELLARARGRRTPPRPAQGGRAGLGGEHLAGPDASTTAAEARGALRDDVPGQPVGVDEHRSALDEPCGDGRLPRPDAPGQPHPQHADHPSAGQRMARTGAGGAGRAGLGGRCARHRRQYPGARLMRACSSGCSRGAGAGRAGRA